MNPTDHYPPLSQWPAELRPAAGFLVQAFALLGAGGHKHPERNKRDALALAAHLSGYWRPTELGKAINVAMGGGRASPRSNVITRGMGKKRREGLADLGLFARDPPDRRSPFRITLTAEGEAAVAAYRADEDIENPVAEPSEPQAQAADTALLLDGQDQDKAINQEVMRMAELIQNRVKSGGQQAVHVNPLRFAPNLSDLILLLKDKWIQQRGTCKLCGGELVPRTSNAMLQASVDRIDSGNPFYSEENTQITHLACNLAKNQYGTVQFLEWLDVVRGKTEFSLEEDTKGVWGTDDSKH